MGGQSVNMGDTGRGRGEAGRRPRDSCVRNVSLGPIAGRSCAMRGASDEIYSPPHCRYPREKTLYKKRQTGTWYCTIHTGGGSMVNPGAIKFSCSCRYSYSSSRLTGEKMEIPRSVMGTRNLNLGCCRCR